MPTIDATLPETIVTTGEEWTIQLSPLFRSGTVKFSVTGHALPADLAPKPNAWNCTSIAGTPATPGEYTVPLIGIGSYGDETGQSDTRSEEHTSELQSRFDLVCRLLLEKKK